MSNVVKLSAGQQAASLLRPQTFAELVDFCERAARSNMVPPAYKTKPDDILIAVQMGSEVGLSPLQALQNISVINGRPALWGDALLGLIRASPLCEDVVERMEGEGDALKAICVMKRRGASAVTAEFSVADAKRAGLWGKQGPWQQYTRRMLQMRARGFAGRDAFPDVLRGLVTAEEAADIAERADAQPRVETIDVQAEPVPAIAAPVPAAPVPPRKMTKRQWLAEFEMDMAAAADAEAMDAILFRPKVQAALTKFDAASLAVLNKIVTATQARLAPQPGAGEVLGDDVIPY